MTDDTLRAADMADDALLTDSDTKEALSCAYVRAVAAYVGYSVSWQDYDRDGIDLRIQAGGYLRPSIGLQLKATDGLGNPNSDGNYRFPLPRGNYDWLIAPSQVPRYLVVLRLPEHRAEWLAVSAESLVLRECCYWVSLEGLPETRNSSSVTVSIPGGNIFDSDALVNLIERSRQGL